MLWAGEPTYLGSDAQQPQIVVVREQSGTSDADLTTYSKAAGEAFAQFRKTTDARRNVETGKAKIANIKSTLAKVPTGAFFDLVRVPLQNDLRKAEAELRAAEAELQNQIAFEETSRQAQSQAIAGFEKTNILLGVGVVLGISLVGLTLVTTIQKVRT